LQAEQQRAVIVRYTVLSENTKGNLISGVGIEAGHISYVFVVRNRVACTLWAPGLLYVDSATFAMSVVGANRFDVIIRGIAEVKLIGCFSDLALNITDDVSLVTVTSTVSARASQEIVGMPFQSVSLSMTPGPMATGSATNQSLAGPGSDPEGESESEPDSNAIRESESRPDSQFESGSESDPEPAPTPSQALVSAASPIPIPIPSQSLTANHAPSQTPVPDRDRGPIPN
jgi:hypothetical protein